MKKNKEFKDLITELRKEKGLTQDELAGKLRITPQAVSKWERGAGMPDVSLIPALAKALGVSIGTLFDERPENEATVKNSFIGLPLVHYTKYMACYSDKTITSSSDCEVKFEDGSTANYSTRTVTNRGPGEIRLVELDSVTENNITDSTATSLNREYSDFRGVSIDVSHPSSVRIVPEEDGFTGIKASGLPEFIANIESEVSDGVLNIKINYAPGNNKNENNNMIVYIPECCKGNHVQVTGSTDLTILSDFDTSFLSVLGSGTITAQNTKNNLCATISGSGMISVGDVFGEGELSIYGSGIINAGVLSERFKMEIAGSGVISSKEAHNASIEIAGSGDVTVGEVSGTLFSQISGSGDIKCQNGDIEKLAVEIYGAGEFDGRALTVKEANIVAEGTGNIELYRITDHSTENLSEYSELKVKMRG